MQTDDRLNELLDRWEEGRDQGRPVTPEELCQDAPELVGELQRRIAALGAVDKLLRGSDTVTDVPSTPDGTVPGPAGRYRALRLHARGGLGEVFVARDEELGREVALKGVRPGFALDADRQARFLWEGRLTGRLEHPGIVPVYGLVYGEDGQPYYAMRFVQGQTLGEAIQDFHARVQAGLGPGERTLGLQQLLRHFLAVCQTVAYAHSKGVLHRDLKPGNILLGQYGETLVADWGLAKPLEPGEKEAPEDMGSGHVSYPGDLEATRLGDVKGSPWYMSPEQAAGLGDKLTTASDVFSLGATLFALLTGHPPVADTDMGVTLDKVRRGDFLPPRKHTPWIPVALEAICLKAMALQPEDRFAGALALAEDVEHFLADEPVQAYPEPRLKRLGRWARRHRTLVSGGAVLLATTVLGLVVGVVLLNRERQQTERQRQAAAEQRDLALDTLGTVVFSITRELGTRPGLEDLREKLLTRAGEDLDRVAHSAETSADVDHGKVHVYVQLGELFRLLGQTKNARRQYERALGVAEVLARNEPRNRQARRDLAIVYEQLGKVCLGMGDGALAKDYCHKDLKITEELAREEPQNAEAQRHLAISYHDLAAVSLDLGDVTAAKDFFGKDLEISEKLARDKPGDPRAQRDLAVACIRLGDVCFRMGETAAAREYYLRDLAVGEELARADPKNTETQRDLSVSYEKLGDVSLELHDLLAAQDYFRKCLDIRETLIQVDPRNAVIRRYLSVTYNRCGKLNLQLGEGKAAREYFLKSLELRRELARSDPDNAQAQRDLAYSFARLGDHSLLTGDLTDAREHYRKCHDLLAVLVRLDRENIEDATDLAEACFDLGTVEEKEFRFDTACDWYRQGRALVQPREKEARFKDQPDNLQLARNLDRSLAVCQVAQKGIDDLASLLSQPAEVVPELLFLRTTVLASRGRHAEAAATAEKLYGLAPKDPTNLYRAACALSLCIPARNREDGLSGAAKTARERYATRAVELLHQAIRLGYQDLGDVVLDSDLNAVRDRADFRDLVRELREKVEKGP